MMGSLWTRKNEPGQKTRGLAEKRTNKGVGASSIRRREREREGGRERGRERRAEEPQAEERRGGRIERCAFVITHISG